MGVAHCSCCGRTPDALQASEAVMVSGDAHFCRVAGLQLRLIR
jgi:hypothetical protein